MKKPRLINSLKEHEDVDLAVCLWPGSSEYKKPLPPGYVNGPNIWDCFIFQYCVEGRGTFVLDGKSYHIHKNQCFVIFPGSIQMQKSSYDDPWAKTWICIYGKKVSACLRELGVTKKSPVFQWEDEPEILEHMYHAIDEVSEKNRTSIYDRISLAARFFSLLEKVQGKYKTEHDINPDKYVNDAISMIENRYNLHLSVSDIVKELNLNRSYFTTLFKKHTGLTPLEYIHRYTVHKACDYFANPNAKVSIVADSLGFEHHVFTRLFKRHMGITPEKYKQELLKKASQGFDDFTE